MKKVIWRRRIYGGGGDMEGEMVWRGDGMECEDCRRDRILDQILGTSVAHSHDIMAYQLLFYIES